MVTIIIPAYNYAHFLPEAIDSALAQAVPGLAVEVLVIDDGSTDETPEVAARYAGRIRYLRQENAGLSAARNTGMREAAHELVVFLDADDLLAPGAVVALHAAREKIHPKPIVLGGRNQRIRIDGSPVGSELDLDGSITDIPAGLLVLRTRFPTTVLADRRILLSLGGFDTALEACEDRDMWIRVAALHPVARLERVVLLQRDHPTSMSKATQRQSENIRRVLDKAFSNPDLQLTHRDQRLALAIWHYQTALMLARDDNSLTATWRMLRSLAYWPIRMPAETQMAQWGRMRAIAGIARKMLSGKRK